MKKLPRIEDIKKDILDHKLYMRELEKKYNVYESSIWANLKKNMPDVEYQQMIVALRKNAEAKRPKRNRSQAFINARHATVCNMIKNNITVQKIALATDLSTQSVYDIAKKFNIHNNIVANNRKRREEREKEFKRLVQEKLDVKSIAAHFKITTGRAYCIAKELNVHALLLKSSA